jgi:hydrogenase/urease accessory protein HupE
VDYLTLGAEHLLTGWDHLLFILGLMFLARGLRALVFTLSAFTLGHSVTLCLAALSLVSVPQPPVELGIAVSLLALALALLAAPPAAAAAAAESVGRPVDGRMAGAASGRFDLPGLAFALGLLHGLGFAGALSETGLPAHQIPVSLLGFNLGVECAQLAVVVPLAALAKVRAKLPLGRYSLQRSAAYVIGTLSACWCIERTLAWIG